MWNAYGWSSFLASYGIGVGLGTARTSSLVFALLSNVGVLGTLFFSLFLMGSLGKGRGVQRTLDGDVRLAARTGCVCLLIGAVVSASTVDVGLLFFTMAALATAVPMHEPKPAHAVSRYRE
jgi:hypothetical protein